MDEFKANFTQTPARQDIPQYDDLSDLEPIKVTKANMKSAPVSNTINFGPITAERLILLAACITVLAMFLPWATYQYNLFVPVSETIVQYRDNLVDAIKVGLAAAVGIWAAVRYDKRKMIIAMVFFAASAGFVIRNSIKIRSAVIQYSDTLGFSFNYDVGFWLYLVGAIFMVVAIILKLIDRS